MNTVMSNLDQGKRKEGIYLEMASSHEIESWRHENGKLLGATGGEQIHHQSIPHTLDNLHTK